MHDYGIQPDSELAVVLGDDAHQAKYDGMSGDAAGSAVLERAIPFTNEHVIHGDMTGSGRSVITG